MNANKMQLFSWVLLLVVLHLSAYTTAKKLPRLVKCRGPRDLPPFPRCLSVLPCPPECPQTCLMDCNLCKPVCSCDFPGAVCQDPRFVGGDGITFYFHGRKDQDFCLVSDPNLHINAHLIGKRNPNLKRDFTWVQSLGVMFDQHKLLVAAQKTSAWDDKLDHLAISLDGKPISIPTGSGSKWASQTLTITRTTSDTNDIVIEVNDNFKITANVVPITAEESRVHGYNITDDDDDCFAHLEVAFKFHNLSDQVDGVLGQTYRSNYESKIKVNAKMPVMGGVNKFRTSGIFDTNCLVSRFGMMSMHKDNNPFQPQQMGRFGRT